MNRPPTTSSPLTMDRPTLLDPGQEAQLRDLGYVVVDGLVERDRLHRLQELSEQVYVDDRSGFHASNLSRHHGYRHAVNERVTPILAPAVEHLFVDHEPFFSSLVIKWPGEDSSFPSHQDWNMVDESRYRSINVFCPLVDATADNGALRVLPRSHRLLRSLRVSPMPPAGCESVGWQVTPDEMDVVELRAGQVLVFDHALLHCSAPNLSDSPRWAVITAFKPRSAELFHWYVPDPASHRVEVFAVDSDFFADIDIGTRPQGDPVRVEEYRWEPLSKRGLLELCGRPGEGSRPEVRQVLQDPVLDTILAEQGWVQVDLLDGEGVARLRAAYDALPHRISEGRSFARGFHATMIDDRADYRQASDAAIRAVLDEPVAALLDRMTWAFSNWVTKEPGAEAAPLHVDWTFVDEDRHRSVSIWMPLVDTDEDTGCLGVVDASHLAVDFVRADTSPTYAETDDWGRSLPGARTVPLRAGQAVVFDHRLVHFSQPHGGPERRVAVTCEFVPDEAELLHFESLGGDRFRRHVVSPEFFVTYAAGGDPRSVPGHVSDSEVSAPTFHGSSTGALLPQGVDGDSPGGADAGGAPATAGPYGTTVAPASDAPASDAPEQDGPGDARTDVPSAPRLSVADRCRAAVATRLPSGIRRAIHAARRRA